MRKISIIRNNLRQRHWFVAALGTGDHGQAQLSTVHHLPKNLRSINYKITKLLRMLAVNRYDLLTCGASQRLPQLCGGWISALILGLHAVRSFAARVHKVFVKADSQF